MTSVTEIQESRAKVVRLTDQAHYRLRMESASKHIPMGELATELILNALPKWPGEPEPETEDASFGAE